MVWWPWLAKQLPNVTYTMVLSFFNIHNHPNHYIPKVWRLSRHSNLGWSPIAYYFNDLQWKIDSIWYESGLEIQSLLFAWFLIENWSNLIWIQPGSLELIIWLILNWKLINFQLRINWIISSRAPGWTHINFDQFWITNLDWKLIKFDMIPAWSSRAHYLIDS